MLQPAPTIILCIYIYKNAPKYSVSLSDLCYCYAYLSVESLYGPGEQCQCFSNLN